MIEIFGEWSITSHIVGRGLINHEMTVIEQQYDPLLLAVN